jgi:hypothetical protein
MRKILKNEYIVIMNMLWKTHNFFGASLIPTRNHATSQAAHQLLEKILLKKCEEAKTIDYGLQILPDIVLRFAKSIDRRFLQAELKAIQDGLTYVEDLYFEVDPYWEDHTYSGYLNAEGQPQGVGGKTFNNNYSPTHIGEWH